MSASFRRLAPIVLVVIALLLLISYRPLLRVAQSTWTQASDWLVRGKTPPETVAERATFDSAEEAPNIASYALAPGDTAPEDESAVESVDVAGKATPRQTLSPAAARSLMQERRRELDCELALSARSPKELAKRERKWRWLPPHMAQAERQALEDAAGRLGRGCPHWKDDPEALKRRQEERQAQLVSAVAANDPSARITAIRPITPQFIEQLPDALYDAVLSGDPELIAQIGWADQWLRARARGDGPEDLIHRPFLWALVACDLGLDCLPGSPTLDRHCLRGTGICGSPTLDAAIRPLYPEVLMTILDQQRDELLQRIRSGQIAGLFDPPPNPPPGGP
ncbi:MAG: hypothetical protein H7A19_00595 [Rhodanobacteraceae bacterium]|nr:hypothetical protein [Rhodanobacteraceae bacterium]